MTIAVIAGTRLLNRYSKRASESTTAASAVAAGAVRGVQVVQAFDAFAPLVAEHENNLKSAMDYGVKKSVIGAILLGSVFFIALVLTISMANVKTNVWNRFAANALAFFEGARIVRAGVSSGAAGTVYAIVFLILDAAFVIGQAGPFIQSFTLAADAGRRIFSVIDHPNISIDVYSEGGISAGVDAFKPGQTIEFTDVDFAYPARPMERVLNAVNFTISAGSSVGIVGASGSGKSTLQLLLCLSGCMILAMVQLGLATIRYQSIT